MLHLASSDEDESLAASMGVGGSVTAASATAGSIGAANLAAASSSAAGASAIAGGNVAAGPNHLGHESVEEEGLYHFRRSKISQYHKVSGEQHFIYAIVYKYEMNFDGMLRFTATDTRAGQLAVDITSRMWCG